MSDLQEYTKLIMSTRRKKPTFCFHCGHEKNLVGSILEILGGTLCQGCAHIRLSEIYQEADEK